MSKTSVDIVLRNGYIADGTGAEPRAGDVAIANGRIAAAGAASHLRGRQELDVSGMWIAPGFIDAHSHDDSACIRDPQMGAKISQGVTTVVVGNCGLSLAPLRFERTPDEPFNLLGDLQDFRYDSFREYAAAIGSARPSVNVVALVGHSTLRRLCMTDLHRPATAGEVDRMARELRSALQAGASGLSSGVYYSPAQSSTGSELRSLVTEVQAYGGVYASHIRDEYDGVANSLVEAFDIARPTQTPLIISHHKCAGIRNWGRSQETLRMIDAASTQQPLALDCYPYTAGSSVLNPALCDGEISVLIGSSAAHPECAGRMLADVAAEWGLSEGEAARRLVPGFASYFQMHEDDVQRILAHPACMVGSDGLPNVLNPHPRLWGTFPRVLGLYARELRLFSMSEAVAKMTSLPAKRFGLVDRGRIAEGMVADITVFDPHTVIDRATYQDPVRPCEGIAHVFVAGVHSWAGGTLIARAGGFLPRAPSVRGGFRA